MNNNNSTVLDDCAPVWADPELTEHGSARVGSGHPVVAYLKYVTKEDNFNAYLYRDDEATADGLIAGETSLKLDIGSRGTITFTSTDELREAANKMIAAAEQFDIALNPGARIIHWPYIPSISRIVMYHRICDGVDKGDIAIPFTGDDPTHPGEIFAAKLADRQPGEVYEHDFKLGSGFPKEHMVDTFIGVFHLKARISGSCALVVEETR